MQANEINVFPLKQDSIQNMKLDLCLLFFFPVFLLVIYLLFVYILTHNVRLNYEKLNKTERPRRVTTKEDTVMIINYIQ